MEIKNYYRRYGFRLCAPRFYLGAAHAELRYPAQSGFRDELSSSIARMEDKSATRKQNRHITSALVGPRSRESKCTYERLRTVRPRASGSVFGIIERRHQSAKMDHGNLSGIVIIYLRARILQRSRWCADTGVG